MTGNRWQDLLRANWARVTTPRATEPPCPGARPYESHEVTLSIDPAKLGVVAMAPFDGKAAKVIQSQTGFTSEKI